MWWSRTIRRRAALIALVFAAGCGFSPVYGPGADLALRGAVTVDAPATDEGFLLRQRILDRLGRPDEPLLHLAVDIEVGEAPVGVTSAQETTRYNLPGTAVFRVTDLEGGAVVLTGTTDAFTSFSATGTAVATLAAERDARNRLAILLADQIVTRLMIGAPDLGR